jgi:hypothetical protein
MRSGKVFMPASLPNYVTAYLASVFLATGIGLKEREQCLQSAHAHLAGMLSE